jgi:hypothetical protein
MEVWGDGRLGEGARSMNKIKMDITLKKKKISES